VTTLAEQAAYTASKRNLSPRWDELNDKQKDDMNRTINRIASGGRDPMKPKRYHDGCSYCDREYETNGQKLAMMPSHTASSRCQSGGYNHCTCDTCF